jgi:hypothetical protein
MHADRRLFLATEREELERQRQARKAEEAKATKEQDRKAAEQLEQARKQDPKSGNGAGQGTSA